MVEHASRPIPLPGARPWGKPLLALDRLWTALEQRIAVVVILAEVVTLCFWVSLKGLASDYVPGPDANVIGLIFRGLAGAVILGAVAHLITRSLPGRTNAIAVTSAMIFALFAGRLWPHLGVAWASNFTEWLQNASSLALVGGPRGVVTRLTLWLALLGASMAASKGKHINIDVATRYLPAMAVRPVAILGWMMAAAVAFAGTWGFFDSIAVTKFRAEAFRSCPTGLCDTPVSERVAATTKGAREDLFLLGRQASLDLRSFPRVLRGVPYDKFMTYAEWNAWVKAAAWTSHFPAAEVDGILMPETSPDAFKMPIVSTPGTGEGRDLLIRDLNFVLPFGLLVIGLKFVLRSLLVLSKNVELHPESAHDEEDLKHAHDHDREVEEAEAT